MPMLWGIDESNRRKPICTVYRPKVSILPKNKKVILQIIYLYKAISLIFILLSLMCHSADAQLTSLYHELPEQIKSVRLLETIAEHDQAQNEEELADELDLAESAKRTEPMWLLSGLNFLFHFNCNFR